MKYRVTFERTAGDGQIPAVVLRAKTREALSAGIWSYVRKFTGDAEFEIFLDTEKMAGVIDGGEEGSFVVEEVARAAAPGTVGAVISEIRWLNQATRSRSA